MSGETLAIHGEPLKRFKVSSLGQSVMIVPIKVQKQVVGLLVVVRKVARPFTPGEQNLLMAVADYASISLVNARLFRALEERARSMQQAAESAHLGEKINNSILLSASRELAAPLRAAREQVSALAGSSGGRQNQEQHLALMVVQAKLEQMEKIVEGIALQQPTTASRQITAVSLNDLARQCIARFQRIAQGSEMVLAAELSSGAVQAYADPVQMAYILDGLVSNAIKFSPRPGNITLRVEKTPDQMPHLTVQDTGAGIESKNLPHVFDPDFHAERPNPGRFSGLGISLHMIKEMVLAQGGKIWVESKTGKGTAFHIVLSPPR